MAGRIQTRTAINNYSSRLGIKGERKFGPELSGIFQVETGVAPDDTANSNAFANRNSFLGLKSASFGTLLAGTHDMPLKTLEGTTGIMWGEGDLVEILVHGRGTDQARGTAWTDVHTRRTNVLLYTSPKIAGALTAKLAYSPDESKGSATPPTTTSPMSGLSLDYSQGMFFAGLATQSHKNAAAANPKMKATKLSLGLKDGAWSTGLAYSKLANGAATELETSNWVLTGSYALDSVVLKASFGKSGETSAANNDGISGLALQADYKLDDKTTLYGTFTRLTNEPGAQARFRGSDGFPTPAAGNDPRALGVGVRYNF